MKKTLLILMGMMIAFVAGLNAQVTTEPTPLQEDSQNVVIYFHADQGNGGLKGLTGSTPIYAHTGVLLTGSTSDSDWKYAPTWGDNSQKYALEYVSTNLWKLNLGDIRTYYGVKANESIRALAFVFRNANGSKEGKSSSGGDIIVPVLESGLQIAMECSIEGDVITSETANATFSISTTEPADIKLYINSSVVASADQATSLNCEYDFSDSKYKNFLVRAQATSGDKTVYVARSFTMSEASPVAEYPGGGEPVMGPVRNADGSVTFCLAAPGKTGVYMLADWNDFTASPESLMNRCDYGDFRYFWLTVKDLDNTKPYRYWFKVDGKTEVGDPYARLILDPSNDKYIPSDVYPDIPEYPSAAKNGIAVAVYQGNLNDYDWKIKNFKGAAKDNLVIYELLLRDFTGTEGQAKGNGNVRLAMEKIPYLKSLGVNAVELLPIQEFNGNNSWGYNPNFYFAPDKAYGTPDDYKALIDELHANGIAVILDVVFNQSDGQHPWYRLYNVGQNPFYNLDAPHAYSVLNDWNQGYGLVRKQWADCVQFWLKEYKVDGFRFDLVKGLGDNDSYANNGDAATNDYNASRVANMKAIKEAMDKVNPDAYFINENLAGAKEENEMAALGMLNWANVNYNGCEYAKGNPAGAGLQRFFSIYDGARKIGSTVSYLESHDEQRLAYVQNLNGVAGVRGDLDNSMHRLGSAAAQMIMCPGSHMIWQFSEMGNDQSTKNSNGGNNTDPKKVRWDDLEVPQRKGLVDNYSKLIALRLANPDLFSMSTSAVKVATGNSSWDNGRYISSVQNERELYVVINPLVDREVTVSIPFLQDSNDAYRVYDYSYDAPSTFSASAKTVTVPANCYVVITTHDISGVKGIEAVSGNTLMARGGRGMLVIDNAPAAVEVYSLNGVKVADLGAGTSSVALPAGIYVARSGNATAKVSVR